jgi:hypothetical protein
MPNSPIIKSFKYTGGDDLDTQVNDYLANNKDYTFISIEFWNEAGTTWATVVMAPNPEFIEANP